MLILKKLNPKKDVSAKYLKWMNDKSVHPFSVQKFKKHTIKNIRKYVKDANNSKNIFLFGIFLKEKKEFNHIGNIKLGPVHKRDKTSHISYFIGEKNYLRKGYTTLAIKKIIKIARKKNLKKLKAGMVEINYGSIRVVKKNGFKKEATLISEELHGNKRYNSLIFGKLL
tara:strand:- start:743 stop:1249 length:507 start_codon:yes stop_codon:yes gene_type:complete